jgi:formylglycine-generating enzyme required for sulfatase activity
MFTKFCVLLAVFTVLVSVSGAQPVEDVQCTDSDPVVLSYDLVGEGVTIEVALSDDSGASDTVAALSLSGDLGPSIVNGTDKRILCDVGAERSGFTSDTMRFQLIASEGASVSLPSGSFALIPAGSFVMGDAFSEGNSNERPVHSVNVLSFYMGKHEVTWSLWLEVRDWAVSNGYSELSGVGCGKADTHPVHTVSWCDVVKWCNAASERAGLEPVYYVSQFGAVFRGGEVGSLYIDYKKQGYRLPTEAEFEKAARGGLCGKRFPWGDTISHANANYCASASYGYDASSGGYHSTFNDGDGGCTSPVGSFAANGYGLYDIAGNVYEWCNDWYGSYSSTQQDDSARPTSGANRVLRGGGWYYYATLCRVAYRYSGDPGVGSSRFGFRLALSQ